MSRTTLLLVLFLLLSLLPSHGQSVGESLAAVPSTLAMSTAYVTLYEYDASGNVTGRKEKVARVKDVSPESDDGAGRDQTRRMALFRITPNPTADVLRVYTDVGTSDACTDFKLFTSSGLYVTSVRMTDGACHLDMTALQAGVYFLQTFCGPDLLSWKIVKR